MKNLFIAIFLLISFQLHAQNNSLSINFGVFSSINLETKVYESKSEKFKMTAALFYSVESSGAFSMGEKIDLRENPNLRVIYPPSKHYGLSINSLVQIGKKGHYLEIAPRIGYIDGGIVNQWAPTGKIGYRRENQLAIFQIGVGFPEILYIGCGIRI